MYAPETYSKYNQYAVNAAKEVLSRKGHLIKWNPDNSDTVLDVGCGPANVLVDVFLRSFKGKYSTCYATDLSEKMIGFAKKTYGNREDIKFMVMDILNVNKFQERYSQVDHVISCYVLHWVLDQNVGFKNIFNLLRPGGDLLTVHCCFGRVFNIYEYNEKSEKWSKYFDNVKKYIPESQFSKQPAQDLRNKLEHCGFTDIKIELSHDKIMTEDRKSMTTFLGSTLAQVQNIPRALRDDYLKEVIDYGLETGIFVNASNGRMFLEFELFNVFAKKPEQELQ